MNMRIAVGFHFAAAVCYCGLTCQIQAATPPKPTYTFKSLGTLGGSTSTAEGLNDAGDVVGDSDLSNGTSAPYVYTAAQGMKNLNVVTDGPLDYPAQQLFGPDCTGDGIPDIYVACAGLYHMDGSSVVVCDGVTGRFVDYFIQPGSGGLYGVAHMAIHPDGDFLIPSSPAGDNQTKNRNRVARFDGQTGAWLGDFVAAGSGGLLGASGTAFGIDLNDDDVEDFFVGSNGTNNVLAYDGTNGAYLGIFIAAGSGGLNGVGSIHFVRDFDGDGVKDLLVVSRNTASVLLYSGDDGHFIRNFVAPVTGFVFNSMVIGPDGDLYIPTTDPTNPVLAGSQLVLRFNGTTGASKGVFVTSGSGGLSGAACFSTFDSNGNLYLNSGNTNQILKFQGPSGTNPGAFVEVFATGVGFTLTSAVDINNVGQIVGSGHPMGRRNLSGEVSAYRYTPPGPDDDVGKAIDLQLPGNTDEEAVAINDDGDVAGYFLSPADNRYHAFLWSASTGKAVDLGLLSGKETFATGIANRSGGAVQVSGYSSGGRAWRYNSATGVMQNLGVLSGSGTSAAWDIDNSGTAVGSASAGSYQHAFARTLTGNMTDLGTLGGNNSYAFGVNASRTVVGTSDTNTKSSQNQYQAFVSTTVHGMLKLEPQITNLPSSMRLKIRPARINTAGAICGPNDSASTTTPGVAYLLIPQ